jgi:hypothetical protein
MPARTGSRTWRLFRDREVEARLGREGRRIVTVDVSKRLELARRYGIAVVPTAFARGPDGTVATRLAG